MAQHPGSVPLAHEKTEMFGQTDQLFRGPAGCEYHACHALSKLPLLICGHTTYGISSYPNWNQRSNLKKGKPKVIGTHRWDLVDKLGRGEGGCEVVLIQALFVQFFLS